VAAPRDAARDGRPLDRPYSILACFPFVTRVVMAAEDEPQRHGRSHACDAADILPAVVPLATVPRPHSRFPKALTIGDLERLCPHRIDITARFFSKTRVEGDHVVWTGFVGKDGEPRFNAGKGRVLVRER
jgi:hypothetical protein